MLRQILMAGVVGAAASNASAALFLHEEFNYTNAPGTVEGQVNQPENQTWVAAYATPAPSKIQVANGNLVMPAAIFPAASGNSAKVLGTTVGVNNTETSGKAIRLPFGGTPAAGVAVDSGGTVYYSLALRADAFSFTNTTTGGFFLGLNNSTGPTTTNPGAAGARLQVRVDPADGTKFNLGIFRNVSATAAATSWSGPLTVGDTLFVVGSYEAVPGAQNDIARLWINPDSSTFADPSFSPLTTPPTVIDNTTATGTDIGIFSVLLRQSPTPDMSLDELRVGTSWAEVTPVPEPLGLAAVAAAGLLPRRTRRRWAHRTQPDEAGPSTGLVLRNGVEGNRRIEPKYRCDV